MSLFILHQISLAIFAAALVIAAFEDVSDYRIPNILIVILFAAYPIYVLSAPAPIDWIWSLGLAGVFFLIGTGLFAAGIMGGGDVKLIALTSLWVGLEGFVPFMIAMALVGGVMSVFMLIAPIRNGAAYFCAHMGLLSVQEKILTDKLPYGVAISAGGLFAVYTMVMG